MGKKQKENLIICFCNNVPKNTIQEAIRSGCHTLNEIYDKTTAGVGPCGGSCRRKIAPILEKYLATGKFDEDSSVESNPKEQRKFP